MLPIRTTEKDRQLKGLAKAYEDGVKVGIKQGMKIAAKIIKDHLSSIEPLVSAWAIELSGKADEPWKNGPGKS